ncbi:hypothetical protein TSOC_013197 [Tetrabaena socialis]|uniref:Uncharacterized protein n=1 Tax=Tetrabaena socialis TaxID=47790 RepID=A0A2J7ZKZ9_9CHLO|nr:hypothetical protein TSOC_013197 [Tetrabaena socialis]|eukprot:PNH00948.1 hypothetical protein TSOC_013197 [Tetrabaena socialis]
MGCSASVAARPAQGQGPESQGPSAGPGAPPSGASEGGDTADPLSASSSTTAHPPAPTAGGEKAGGAGDAEAGPQADAGVQTAAAANLRTAEPAEEVPSPPAPPLAVHRDESPLAAVSKGITLRGLRRLKTLVQSHFGAEAYAAASTAEVNTAWVQVVTAGERCRLAEHPDLVAPEDVGVPMYFISHAWKNSFDLLLRGIEGFLESADEETRVWVDIVAVNQVHGRACVCASIVQIQWWGRGEVKVTVYV